MPEIRLVKKYPHIKDEDVISIFQEGYTKGFENGRKGAIPVEWIRDYVSIWISEPYKNFALNMIKIWEKENERLC